MIAASGGDVQRHERGGSGGNRSGPWGRPIDQVHGRLHAASEIGRVAHAVHVHVEDRAAAHGRNGCGAR